MHFLWIVQFQFIPLAHSDLSIQRAIGGTQVRALGPQVKHTHSFDCLGCGSGHLLRMPMNSSHLPSHWHSAGSDALALNDTPAQSVARC